MKRDVIEAGQEQDDEALLRAFEKSGSEPAFRELVRRHLGMVIGAAVRRTGDRSLAEEVAQNVFTALAAKASRLKARPTLAGWLYRATMLECSAVMRSERSRKRRMNAFSTQALIESEGHALWEEALPVLDEAIDALPNADRTLILLRFFERKSFREIGALSGKSEGAAQKQAERALERLSGLLRRKGVVIPTALLVSGLATQVAPAAPAGLVLAISQSAVAGAAAITAKTLVIQTLEIMAQTKIKTVAAVVIAAAIAVPVVYQLRSPDDVVEPQPTPTPGQSDSAAVPNAPETAPVENLNAPPPTRSAPEIVPLAKPSPDAARPSETAAGPPPEQPGPPPDSIASAPFRASVSATLQPGETLVTGGWATAPGMRSFVFITPTAVAATGDRREMIEVSPLMVEAKEAVWRSLGFDTIMTHAPDSTVNETLSSELAGQLMQAFKEVVPEAIKTRPRMMTVPGQQTAMTMSHETGGGFNTFQLTPSALGANGAITLEARIGLGHGAQPGMTFIGPASLTAPPAPRIP